MRLHHRVPVRTVNALVLVLLVVALASLLPVHGHGTVPTWLRANPKLEATIFSWDGKDFTRKETTLLEKGNSAAGTRLEHATPAYKALSEKHSYSGETTVFGKKYDAYYAPLTSDGGELTGALFVGVAK